VTHGGRVTNEGERGVGSAERGAAGVTHGGRVTNEGERGVGSAERGAEGVTHGGRVTRPQPPVESTDAQSNPFGTTIRGGP
jgi:hypothetical protein